MEQYISGIESALRDKGFRGKFLLVKSDGGLATAEMMKRCPEAMLLSGPAAGVFSGLNIGKLAGERNILCQDMGGTSYDVCIIEDGQILQTTEYQLDVDMPIITPLLDVRSIGTGGGSIAWIDTGGSFRVGPQSAGSKPGPACYGFGGENPTVTDANLVLGRIDETLGGKLELDKNAAYAAVKTKIADPLGIDPIEAAEGMIRISCNNMARAISLVTTDRGRDPRNFVPTVFGGAGPMHICFVAELLDIAKAIVPAASGVCSAEGAVMMPLKIQSERTFLKDTAGLKPEELDHVLEEIRGKVSESLVEQGAVEKSIVYRNIAEMRYIGQTYEVPVEIPSCQLNKEKIAKLIERFHNAHEKEYFVSNREFSTAVVNVRVEGTATVGKLEYPVYPNAEYEVEKAVRANKKVIFDGEHRDTVIFDYEKLMPTHKIKGPLIIEMEHACCVVAPNWDVTVDQYKNLILNKVK
jgi:N-methylhydantoinase A